MRLTPNTQRTAHHPILGYSESWSRLFGETTEDKVVVRVGYSTYLLLENPSSD